MVEKFAIACVILYIRTRCYVMSADARPMQLSTGRDVTTYYLKCVFMLPPVHPAIDTLVMA